MRAADSRHDGSRGGGNSMTIEERAVAFPCNGDWLYGILSQPGPASSSKGVLIVVGGPQYRVGSHRQFVLLARHLAFHGIPVLRFDYRGMGDSEGDARTFEDLEDDLRCAIDHFFEIAPSLGEVVMWGLCDAASAALFYAHRDERVTGLVLLNPWARTDEGFARTHLKHYYANRLFEKRFWEKILRGRFDYVEAVRSLARTVGASIGSRRSNAVEQDTAGAADACALPERMRAGLALFSGKVLLITSGNDLTAREFLDTVEASPRWRELLASPRVSRFHLPLATHTFSRREWRDQVATHTAEWMRSW